MGGSANKNYNANPWTRGFDRDGWSSKLVRLPAYLTEPPMQRLTHAAMGVVNGGKRVVLCGGLVIGGNKQACFMMRRELLLP